MFICQIWLKCSSSFFNSIFEEREKLNSLSIKKLKKIVSESNSSAKFHFGIKAFQMSQSRIPEDSKSRSRDT